MLAVNNLQFGYNAENTFKFPDFACQAGEKWLILGQSGCGKTTLLHLIAGLLKPKSGTVTLSGQDLTKLSDAKLDEFRGQHIGLVFQQNHLLNSLSVADNLRAAQYFAKEKQDDKRVKQLLEQLNLGNKLKARPQELSQGQRQRVAIARALVNSPALVLADEPTSSLDDKNTEEVINMLESAAAGVQATLLIVTHDGRLKERYSNRIEL